VAEKVRERIKESGILENRKKREAARGREFSLIGKETFTGRNDSLDLANGKRGADRRIDSHQGEKTS